MISAGPLPASLCAETTDTPARPLSPTTPAALAAMSEFFKAFLIRPPCYISFSEILINRALLYTLAPLRSRCINQLYQNVVGALPAFTGNTTRIFLYAEF